MKITHALFGPVIAILAAGIANATPATSYFPENDVELFLVKHFDLASIRSSLGPRRAQAQRTFADMGRQPSKAADGTLAFDEPGYWFYEMKILARRDVNRDGLEDLEVCFRDRAQNGGSYNSTQGLVLTRYSADSYVVAIRFGLDNSACRE